MIRQIPTCVLAVLFSFSAFGQSPFLNPCDVKETPCVRFEMLGVSVSSDKHQTYWIKVVNNCPDPLQYVVFQLPKGMIADQPASNSTYTAPSGREYQVRNPNAAPFHSIRFKTVGAGIANGESDIFEYSLSPQAKQTYIGAMARLKPEQTFQTYLTIFDCDQQITVEGNIRTEADEGVAKVAVQVDVTTPSQDQYTLFTTTDIEGAYSFPVGANDAYTITPRRNDQHLNGIATYDLVLLTQHILAVNTLNSPYKIIAADADNNQSIGTNDIVELRKLILFIYTELPNNTSWRFVDKKYVFPNLMNPFQPAFPETISASGPHLTPPVHDFVGMKVGDLNGNASTN